MNLDPAHARIVRNIERWAMILRAIGKMPDDEDEYFRRPWQFRGRGLHPKWLKAGKPRPPGERDHDPVTWQRFLDSI